MESISECSPLGARLAESSFIPRHAHFASFCASAQSLTQGCHSLAS